MTVASGAMAQRSGSELDTVTEVDVVLSNEDFGLTPEARILLAEAAMSGDAEAAAKLTDYYFFDLTSGKEATNRECALKWALIGAENGSPGAQFRAYQL